MSNKKNDSEASLDDQELKLFFDALQKKEPKIDPDFYAHLQSQAITAMPQPINAWAKPPQAGLIERIARAVKQFDSWPAGLGLTMVGAAGVIIGMNPPDTILDLTTAYFQAESLSELAGMNDDETLFWEDT